MTITAFSSLEMLLPWSLGEGTVEFGGDFHNCAVSYQIASWVRKVTPYSERATFRLVLGTQSTIDSVHRPNPEARSFVTYPSSRIFSESLSFSRVLPCGIWGIERTGSPVMASRRSSPVSHSASKNRKIFPLLFGLHRRPHFECFYPATVILLGCGEHRAGHTKDSWHLTPMIHRSAILFLILVSFHTAFGSSKISSFAGSYEWNGVRGGLSFVFKAAPHKEWGGYKMEYKSVASDSSWTVSYSFRNTRFEFRSGSFADILDGIGTSHIGKGIITYEATIRSVLFGRDEYILKGTIRQVPNGLLQIDYTYNLDGTFREKIRSFYIRKP